jgi:Tfp pilus assembly protein PilO
MIQSSNKKILELTPKAKKKSIHAIDPMEKFKNKIDKNFNKFIDAQKKLKDQFKENNKKAAKELNNLRKEIGTSRKETQQLLKQVSLTPPFMVILPRF